MCELCTLVEDRVYVTKKYFEDATFVMVDCKVCYTPMLVYKKHQTEIDEADKAMAYHIFYKHSQRIDMSKWYVDYKMRKIPDHWHCHLRRM